MNNSKTIVSIVPRLQPAVDGVGDYALNLARQLRLDFGTSTHFLICDPTWIGNSQLEGFQVSHLEHRAVKPFLAQLAQIYSDSPILLHYVSYGYARKGCPAWLIKGLEDWKHQSKQASLMTMFHELFAFGPIWTSAFWLSALQRNLARRLARASDCLLTSKQGYANILRCYCKSRFDQALTILPVFSTVGEVQSPAQLTSRTRRLVIFGGRSKRLPIYQMFQPQLQQICQHLDIQDIYDVGPLLDFCPSHIGNVPITATGALPSYDISRILASSIAGFFNYNLAYLSKSTIFAAYCSHGMLPISAQPGVSPEDGILPGKHYVVPDQFGCQVSRAEAMQAIADNAYAWYQAHNLSRQAQAYYTLLSSLKAT